MLQPSMTWNRNLARICRTHRCRLTHLAEAEIGQFGRGSTIAQRLQQSSSPADLEQSRALTPFIHAIHSEAPIALTSQLDLE